MIPANVMSARWASLAVLLQILVHSPAATHAATFFLSSSGDDSEMPSIQHLIVLVPSGSRAGGPEPSSDRRSWPGVTRALHITLLPPNQVY